MENLQGVYKYTIAGILKNNLVKLQGLKTKNAHLEMISPHCDA